MRSGIVTRESLSSIIMLIQEVFLPLMFVDFIYRGMTPELIAGHVPMLVLAAVFYPTVILVMRLVGKSLGPGGARSAAFRMSFIFGNTASAACRFWQPSTVNGRRRPRHVRDGGPVARGAAGRHLTYCVGGCSSRQTRFRSRANRGEKELATVQPINGARVPHRIIANILLVATLFRVFAGNWGGL